MQLLLDVAYVHGDVKDGHSIIQEKPFEMGQSLNGTSKLDILTEINLLERKLAELQAMNVEENTTKYAMKDYGMERFIKFLLSYFLFFFGQVV